MKKDIKSLFKKVKLLILDVDGVLTKGEIIYDDTGRELKIFNVKDGLGIYLLSRVGIKTILLSARDGSVIRKRAKDMSVAEVIAGILPKEKNLERIKNSYKVKTAEICFVGDDLIDLELMKRVGLAVAVKDAPQSLRRVAHYVTSNRGGEGAVREVVDLVLGAQGLLKKVEQILKAPR
ncbi:MAG: HAD-IIIA family hydrolase [Candidatus Omnitrophota bacterium]|nr:MAG: HAD-IIIA family hydrolase [Candidatus Omnitrophota bacterium]